MSGNYPDGMPGRRQATLDMNCSECGEAWEAMGWWELGSYSLESEDDAQCPNCGSWDTE